MTIQDPPTYLRLLPACDLSERPDVELVYALQANQAWARREVWDRYSGGVRRYLARALGRQGDEVEDLTQEVFLRLFSHRGSVRRPELLRHLTTEVAVRVLKSNLRGRWLGRQITHSRDGDASEEALEPEQGSNTTTLRRCGRILDTLDAQERTAFTLRFMEGLTFEEVAEAMTVSSYVARRLTHRATKVIAGQLRSDPLLRRGCLENKAGGRT